MAGTRTLDPTRPYKPLDFGNGLVAGSVAPDGQLLSVGTGHGSHGYMALSRLPPLADDRRRDQRAVRVYRAALAAPTAPTFGLRPPAGREVTSAGLLGDAIPVSTLRCRALRCDVVTWAPVGAAGPLPAAVQRWEVTNASDATVSWAPAWGPLPSLRRAAMTELTEGVVVAMPAGETVTTVEGQRVLLAAPGLPAAACLEFHPEAVALPPGGRATVTVACALAPSTDQAAETLRAAIRLADVGADAGRWIARWRHLDRRLPVRARLAVHRALAYLRACCALPVAHGTCLITDHQILPLSWNRDAYYLAHALLADPDPEGVELVRRHLLWLFEVAERPDGWWARAYLPNGAVKDTAFQLDQQCYPLLELADYAALTGDEGIHRRLAPHLRAVLAAIRARQAPSVTLFATEETPADDPAALPYHCSSHILLWRTLRRLAPLHARLPLPGAEPETLAAQIRAAVWRHFPVAKGRERLLAYATDLDGRFDIYQDANDLPLALAPTWGFCAAGDPTWRATMAFAFGRDNVGWVPGRHGGLGSRHTAGGWPLGDVQELVYARLIGDAQRFEAVLGRVSDTTAWDGALPEARDPATGAVTSRHWFAWPGAALACALLEWTPREGG